MGISKVCIVAALCSFVFLATFIGSTQSASCCLRYTKHPLPCKRLLGYSIQNINTSCDIDAVIFHVPGKFVCANPAAKWTKRRMDCLDERRRTNAEILKEETRGNATSA
ncbi:C-C motif chemokine 20b [Enoplosus armatus]|uniref:C-C motif chemokine 20b n=1 Tax=Enoplosus armatus TaxID=215367 RepID=UPI003995F2EE